MDGRLLGSADGLCRFAPQTARPSQDRPDDARPWPLAGSPIVPAEWVKESARPLVAAGRGAGTGYGYFWWTGDIEWKGKTLPWSAAVGNGGQRLFLVPALDVVVVMTAGAYNDTGIVATEGNLLKQVVATVLH